VGGKNFKSYLFQIFFNIILPIFLYVPKKIMLKSERKLYLMPGPCDACLRIKGDGN